MIVLVREFGRRLAIMFGGEALQSGFHFVLNIVLMHTTSASDYGAFALAMIIAGFALTYVRALAAMPASIWIGSSRSLRRANVYDVTFGTGALLIAIAAGLIAALVLWVWLGTRALAAGAFVGVWSLRSYLRIATFARRKPVPAVAGDAVFALSGTLFVILMLWIDASDKLQTAFMLLVGANSLALATTLIGGRRRVRVTLRRSIRRRFADNGRQLWWSGLGTTVTNLQGQGFAFVVASMAGLAAYAPIAAILVLFVPLRLFSFAVANMLQPSLAADSARGEWTFVWQQARTWTLAIGAGTLAYGGSVVLTLHWLYPPVFEGAPIHLIVALIWAITASYMLYVLPRIILEACGALRVIAIISGVSAIFGICLPAAILVIAPPAWALLGGLVSEQIVLIGLWFYLHLMVTAGWNGRARRGTANAWKGMRRSR